MLAGKQQQQQQQQRWTLCILCHTVGSIKAWGAVVSGSSSSSPLGPCTAAPPQRSPSASYLLCIYVCIHVYFSVRTYACIYVWMQAGDDPWHAQQQHHQEYGVHCR
jgi:hypothetical protein